MVMDQALVDQAIAAWHELELVAQSHDSMGELMSRHLGSVSNPGLEAFCQWSNTCRCMGRAEGRAEVLAAQLLAAWPEGEETVGVMAGGKAYLLMRSPQGIQVLGMGDGRGDQSTQVGTHGTQ
jgi:hypothetical protein